MNQEQIKDLIELSTRAAILLGEITGRLIMIVEYHGFGKEKEMLSQIENLLSMMEQRITDIYYKQNGEIND